MPDLLALLVIISVLIGLNGLYVAAEFSVISLPKIRLEQDAAKGDVGARRYLEVISNSMSQDRFIAVAQMGITLASLGLGMYGEHAAASLLVPYFEAWGGLGEAAAHSLATLAALLFLTYWHIVAGEMVPKSLALLHPIATAKVLWWPMRISGFLLAPLGFILNAMGNFMLRLLGLPVSKDLAIVYSPEELRMVLDESRDEGLLKPEQAQMLERVIDFGMRPVRQIMTPRTQIVGLPDTATVREAVELLKAEEYSRYPVYHGDRDGITGVVHVKDLFGALRRGELERHVSELQLPVVFLPESLPQDEALEQLRASQGHLAVVVEDRGGTAGIITAEDLIEELFGEIRDEFDSEELALAEVQEQGWRVSGQISLFELEEVLGRELARTPDAETLAGLLFDLLHRVPEEGDCIDHDGFRFVVETVQQHTVSFCIIVPLEVPEGGGSAS
jgi:CBS domain containing-hemolysin-like protein